MKAELRFHSRRNGFSLVEILVVVGVIGVLAAIAVFTLSGLREESIVEKNRNNAQSLVNVYTAARAAGVTFDASTLGDLISQIRDGKHGKGITASTRFSFNLPVTESDIAPFVQFTSAGGGESESLTYITSRP